MELLLAKGGEAAVSFLVSTGLEMAIEEIKRIRRVPKDIQRLINTVNLIKEVLEDAEEKQISKDAVRSWLRQLKQVFLEAEDLLDEITTDASLASMSADGRKKVRVRRLRSFIYKIKRRIGATARQIQDINEKLDDLARQKDMLGLQPVSSVETKHVEYRRRQLTSSLLADETSVIGRDSEREEIKKLLLSSSCEAESSNNRSFSILPIVGMGGLGKTTLARLVYNDAEVKEHFELKMWVCVSNDFDLMRLTKEMVDATPTDSWESMQQKLHRKVEGKTFLLVLDDVWVVNRSQWDNLFEPLNFAKKGSKIVMTTRFSKSISDCPALTSLSGVGVPAAGRRSQMTQLSSVTIERCHELTSLGEFLDQAPSLRVLKLTCCKKLSSLPEMGLPASLLHLWIEDCPRLKEQCGEQGCPDWPKISHIPNVYIEMETDI